jgi:hypothetical protein
MGPEKIDGIAMRAEVVRPEARKRRLTQQYEARLVGALLGPPHLRSARPDSGKSGITRGNDAIHSIR